MFRGKGKAGELRRYWEVKGGGRGIQRGGKRDQDYRPRMASYSFIFLYLNRLVEKGKGWGLRGHWEARVEECEV